MQPPIITPSRTQATRMSLLFIAVVIPLFLVFEGLLALADDEPWSQSTLLSSFWSSLPFWVGGLGANVVLFWWPRHKLRWQPEDLATGEVVCEKALVYRHWQRESQHELMVLTNRRLIFTDTQNDPWEIPIREVRVLGLRHDWRPGLRKTVLHYQGKNLILDGWVPQTELLQTAEGAVQE